MYKSAFKRSLNIIYGKQEAHCHSNDNDTVDMNAEDLQAFIPAKYYSVIREITDSRLWEHNQPNQGTGQQKTVWK